MTDDRTDLTTEARDAATRAMAAWADNDDTREPLPHVMADAVLAVARTHYERVIHRAVNELHGRCRWCRAIQDATRWGVKVPQPHRMECRLYIGPLTHTWTGSRVNLPMGGVDHYCACGAVTRVDLDEQRPECRLAHETHRPMPSTGRTS